MTKLFCIFYIYFVYQTQFFDFSFGSFIENTYLCPQLTTTPAMIGFQEIMVTC